MALISGGAAAYAVARKDVASALPGVAIAVALVPPLATVGLAAAAGEPQVAIGAGLLFLTNLVAIVAAAAIVFLWMGFHPDAREERRARTFRGGMATTATLFVAVAVVLGVLTASSIRTATLRDRLDRSLDTQVSLLGPDVALVDWRLEQTHGGTYEVEVTVQATRGITPEEAAKIQGQLAVELQRPVSIAMTVLPATRLDAVTPRGDEASTHEPTPTPPVSALGDSP